jgi:WD40 repeat protein
MGIGEKLEVKSDGATAEATSSTAPAARYDVFLCHNSLDKPLVKDAADALQIEAGILFFLDEFSIPASVEFMEFIRGEMRRAAACVIFLGSHGWGGTHLTEAKLALDVKHERPNFRIIPVNLPGKPTDGWGTLFGIGHEPPFNWIEFSGANDDAGRMRLIEAIHGRFPVRASGPEAVTPYYIRRQAALWDKSGRTDNSLLIGGRLLLEAQGQSAANPEFVNVNGVPAYLTRCVQRQRNRLRAVVAATSSAAILAAVLAAVAYSQRNEALRQRQAAEESARVAQTRSLASLAIRSIGEDREDDRALLLARQAYLLDRTTGGRSSYIVSAALSEVLGTPYLSSKASIPAEKILEHVSPSGAYLLSGGIATTSDRNGGDKRVLTGPIVDPTGKAAAPRDAELDVPIADFLGPKDSMVVATKDGDIETRTVESPTRREKLLAALGKPPAIMVVSRDGTRVIVVLDDSELTSIDIAKPGPPKRWKLPQKIENLAVSADGTWVASTDDRGTLRVYAWGASRPASVYPTDDSVNSYQFGSGSLLVVGERGGGVWMWDANARTTPRRRLDDGKGRGSIDSIAISADGRTAATASGSITPGISLWNIAEGKPIATIPGPRAVAKLAFTTDGRFLISGLTSGETRYWRMNGAGASRAVRALDWQPFPRDARLYSVVRDPKSDAFLVGGDHGIIQRYSSPTLDVPPVVLAAQRRSALEAVPNLARFVDGGRNFLLTGHVMAITFSKSGKRFATVDPYGFALVWNATTSTQRPALVPSPDIGHAAFSVALSPSGHKLAVGATSSVTFVHELDDSGASTEKVAISSSGDDTVRAMTFADDNTVIVGDDHGRLVRWHLDGQPKPETLISAGPAITSLALRRDSRLLVGRGDEVDSIELGQTSGAIKVLSKGLGWVDSVAVSEDGGRLAVGFSDGIIRIFSLDNSNVQPVLLNVHRDIVRSLAFDVNGKALVSVGDDGMIKSTVIGEDRLGSLACDALWRDLDPDEIRSYFESLSSPSLPTCTGTLP